MQPKMTVIVPVYNTQAYLQRCVDSILQQTNSDFEVILVDDGSTDNSGDLCDAYAQAHDIIEVIHQENAGLSASRNAGIKRARGEYIMFVDSDDYIEPDAIQRFCEVIDEFHPDIIAADSYDEIDGNKIASHRFMLKPQTVYSARDFIIESIKGRHWYSGACFCVYNKDYLVENNIFFTEGILHEDVDFQPRVFLPAHSIVYLDYLFYSYIHRSGSIIRSTDNIKRRIHDINLVFSAQRALYDGVEDQELQRYLYGMLIKQYMAAVKELGHRGMWDVAGMNFTFMLKYALSFKEKLKVLLYELHIFY